MRKRKKEYAIFSVDVRAKDKYKVTRLPKKFFSTKRLAKRYIKKKRLKGVKILTY